MPALYLSPTTMRKENTLRQNSDESNQRAEGELTITGIGVVLVRSNTEILMEKMRRLLEPQDNPAVDNSTSPQHQLAEEGTLKPINLSPEELIAENQELIAVLKRAADAPQNYTRTGFVAAAEGNTGHTSDQEA